MRSIVRFVAAVAESAGETPVQAFVFRTRGLVRARAHVCARGTRGPHFPGMFSPRRHTRYTRDTPRKSTSPIRKKFYTRRSRPLHGFRDGSLCLVISY